MTNAPKSIPDNAISGKLVMSAKIGDIIAKTGKARKQNVYDVDFGQIAITGSLYGKIDGQEYTIVLIPTQKK